MPLTSCQYFCSPGGLKSAHDRLPLLYSERKNRHQLTALARVCNIQHNPYLVPTYKGRVRMETRTRITIKFGLSSIYTYHSKSALGTLGRSGETRLLLHLVDGGLYGPPIPPLPTCGTISSCRPHSRTCSVEHSWKVCDEAYYLL